MEPMDVSSRTSRTILCFMIFFFMITSSVTSLLTNETDLLSLLAIKDLISGDPLGTLSSWNNSIPFCNWQGVTCGSGHQRVTALNLSSGGLVGSVSPHIGNLTFLKRIDLRKNNLGGKIPPEMGTLSRLQVLIVSNNTFQGEFFPTNLSRWRELRVIDVADNNLEGTIPAELGFNWPSLTFFNLWGNQFTGTIPPSVGNLSNLQTLSVANNNFEGSIPSEVGHLSQLKVLQLSSNNFSGTIPPSVYNLSFIYYFSLVGNNLEGVLPPDLGSSLPRLQLFLVAFNQLHGTLPPSLANASGLVQVGMGYNSFIGSPPMNLGTLADLGYFSVAGNSMGTNDSNELVNFITSLSNCTNLESLSLELNSFSGLLPHSIANLSTKISWLSLNENYISGSIPLDLGNIVISLRRLQLFGNMLTGSIPDSIGQLSMIEILLLGTNNLFGKIPTSIGNLTRLGVLEISHNMLEGSIPVSLGNCTNLQRIYLGHNSLTGAITPQVFALSSLILLLLGNNSLTGLLPVEVGSLIHLGNLDVSENKLSGEIPATLSSCQGLELLYMGGNLFEGTIPASFNQLKSLQLLDISRNNLSGQIPKFLGELQLLHYLDLSNNMFDGDVPTTGVFTNTSEFSVVGNNKLCGGIQVLQLPACSENALKGRQNSVNGGKVALVVTLPIVLTLVCLSYALYRIKRSKQQASSTVPLQNHHLQLSYGELHQATNGFSSTNLIGEGGYGFVYKADLRMIGRMVAVKVLNLVELGANKSFIAECEALRSIRHRNLVKLITSCSSIDFKGNDFKALVFNFMENGSLESWLHPRNLSDEDPKNLNFVQRLNISIDVACALDYLHHQCEMGFIHCDLKPSNILLDDEFCAHVGDFGLAKIISPTTGISDHQQSGSIGIRGTIGYVAPEYGMGEEVTRQGDMYSYGVLLLEMFTGKRPTDSMFIDNLNLHSFVKVSVPNQVMEIVDPRIRLNIEKEVCLASVLQLGVSCSAELPTQRMNARDVLIKLQKIRSEVLGGQARAKS